MYFFFQAEDGIRDGHVTGVQTCALPICPLQTARELPSSSASLYLADDRMESGGFFWPAAPVAEAASLSESVSIGSFFASRAMNSHPALSSSESSSSPA